MILARAERRNEGEKKTDLIAFSGDFCFDGMIEDSSVSSVNETLGVDGYPFGVGQADGVHVLRQSGFRFQLNQRNVGFRNDEGTSNSDNLEKKK